MTHKVPADGEAREALDTVPLRMMAWINHVVKGLESKNEAFNVDRFWIICRDTFVFSQILKADFEQLSNNCILLIDLQLVLNFRFAPATVCPCQSDSEVSTGALTYLSEEAAEAKEDALTNDSMSMGVSSSNFSLSDTFENRTAQ